jgi:hypothetical protein
MALANDKRRRVSRSFLMRRFAAKAIARAAVRNTARGGEDDVSYDRPAAWRYRQALLTLDDPEMAEQIVSELIIAECVLRCGSPWRGCGIPADDLCLLAMHGARPLRANEAGTY